MNLRPCAAGDTTHDKKHGIGNGIDNFAIGGTVYIWYGSNLCPLSLSVRDAFGRTKLQRDTDRGWDEMGTNKSDSGV